MEPGQQISANLRLVRLLGQGGMGSVWIADHLALGTQVAVKVMSRSVASEPMFVERFRREALAAAQLKSPHVAHVFDHGITAGGEPFIVMELLEGEDLSKRVERDGPQPLAFVADVVGQAAKALSRAHAAGIIHRDIKAENIFLSEHDGDLHLKILDFGIAKTSREGSASVTTTQGTFGTPLYMGPEQLLSAKHVDSRADLWSLAVVAYFMLTRRFPFEGETLGAISVAVHEGRFRRPSELRAGLSADVDAWFARAFRRDPAARFASAKELSETLRGALGTSSITSPAISSPLAGLADPQGIGSLPTMDSRAAARGGDLGPAPSPTLGGASIPGAPEPKRRRLLLAAAGLVGGALVAVLVLRSVQPAPASPAAVEPAKEPVAASVSAAPSAVTVTVAPSATDLPAADPSATASAAAGGAAAATPSATPSGTASASAAPRGPVKAPAGGATSKTAAPASTKKKDDIGF